MDSVLIVNVKNNKHLGRAPELHIDDFIIGLLEKL